jgi:hypothetical protein
MADKTLSRTYFPIFRKTNNDAKRSIQDPFGYFSCRESTTRFLDLEEKAKAVIYSTSKTRKGYTKSVTLVDGTKLTSTDADTTKITVVESQITLSVSARGSRSVIIKTGKKLPPREVDGKTIQKGYHTVSFRFPSWATIWTISDALGELIPSAKFDVSPSETKIYPYFTVKGGRKYLIMSETAAEENTDASVPETPQQMTAVLEQVKKKGRKAAGGDA